MSGWISLNRSIQKHWIYEEKRTFSKYEAWLDLLFMVNHTEKQVSVGNQLIDVKRGQRITSIKKLSEQWGWSRSKVNSFLKLLESDDMITFKPTSKYTLVTIVNYDFYQSEKNRNNINSTSNQHQKDINSTSNQHQSDTNNNDNNELIMKNNENNNNNRVGVDYNNQDFSIIVNEWQKLGFGMITERSTEQILDWLKDHDKDLILHVIQYAHDNGAINQRYVQAVLKSAREKNVKTVADFEAEQQKRAASRRTFNGKTNNQVIQPKWFTEKKQTEEPKEIPKDTKADSDISDLINQFRKGPTP